MTNQSVSTSKNQPMSFQDWVETFKPLNNHFYRHASIDGLMFELSKDEIAFVDTQDASLVWTAINGDDGSMVIASGFHTVNRAGYLVATVPNQNAIPFEVTVYEADDEPTYDGVDFELIQENNNILLAEEMGIAAAEQALRQ